MLFHEPEIVREENPTPSPGGGRSSLEKLSKKFKARALSWSSKTGFSGGPGRRGGRQIVLWSWMASLIDSLLLLGLSCLFVLVFARIVQTSTESVFLTMQEFGVQSMLSATLLVGSWFYMVLSRSVFGSSVGEWACDLRLGPPSAEFHPRFIWKVILRATLILATGIVSLPLLSFLTGRDVAGHLSGLKLFSLK
jgi:hypothetical protein